MDALFEHGTVIAIRSKAKEVLMSRLKKSVDVYENIEDYVAEVTSRKTSTSVELENIETTLIAFSSCLMFVLLVFALNILLSKHLHAIHQKLDCLLLNFVVLFQKSHFVSFKFGDSN